MTSHTHPSGKAKRFRLGHRAKTVLLGLATLLLVAAGALVIWAATMELPNLETFSQRKVVQSTKIYDRTGEVLLYDVHNNVRRTVVPFDTISEYIKNATLAIEDDTFYSHFGVRPLAIIRAFFANIISGSFSQGGSTITQQVVKKTLLTDDKFITRKIKEAILALKLERQLTKDEIFSIYLNENPYGGSIYGVEEASRSFFGKKSSEVTLAEAAYLAALPQAPSYYSPYGSHRDRLDARKNLVLERMYSNGMITAEERDQARAETVVFQADQTGGIKAPHFVMYVRSYLEEKYGRDALENTGLKVTTTLDWELQQKAEATIAKYGPENERKFKAKQAAMVGMDPKTGQILVMVGSRNYFETENDGNFNITTSHRQPGSSFKPFVYATAFAEGYTPDTVLFDVQTQFDTNCSPTGTPLRPGANCYMPENYDNVYRGPVSMRNALAQSINIPALKALYLVGTQDAIKTARALGVKSLSEKNNYGLTLVLGGGEVSLLEMSNAYSSFANDGVRNPETAILKVETLSGEVLEEFVPSPERAIDSEVARQVSDVLSDNAARAPAFGENSALYIPGHDIAVKTGTTNDYKDAWILGYTPNFTLGAWVGNNDNTPMEKKVAGFIVAPIWNEVMRAVVAKLPSEHFVAPEKSAEYDSLKPVLRGVWQGGETRADGSLINSVHDILYWVDRRNPTGPKPTNPETDSQFVLWETPVRAWALSKGYADEDPNSKPLSGTGTGLSVKITSPIENASVARTSRVNVTVGFTSGTSPLSQVDYFVNSTYLGSSKSAPYSFSFSPQDVTGIQGVNTLRAVGFDTAGNHVESQIQFLVN